MPGTSIEADLMMKFLEGIKNRQNMVYHNTMGRTLLALKAALDDGFSLVPSDRQRTENTRTDVRHDDTVQAAQKWSGTFCGTL